MTVILTDLMLDLASHGLGKGATFLVYMGTSGMCSGFQTLWTGMIMYRDDLDFPG